MQEEHYFLQEGVLLHHIWKWQEEEWRQDYKGKGDTLFATFIYAMAKYKPANFLAAHKLLKEGNRWPDSLNHPTDCQGPLAEKLRKIIYKENRYRYQKWITRDPIIMHDACAVMIGYEAYIPKIKIPWYTWRPNIFFWRKYIMTHNPIYKTLYEWTTVIPRKMYAKHLCGWQAYIADSEKIKKKLRRTIPSWNLLLLYLTDHPLRSDREADNYRSKKRYQWCWSEWIDYERESDYLDGQSIQLDKDILNYVKSREWHKTHIKK